MAKRQSGTARTTVREVQPRLAVRLRDWERTPPGGDREREKTWSAVAARTGLADIGATRTLPLIESVSPDRLAALVDRARELDPEYRPAAFDAWFQVVLPDDADPDEAVARLRRDKGIETAYVMRAGEPPVNPADDPRATNQGYLDAAPNGIDARYAWGFAGGDGAGIGVVDMEQGWNLDHEDLVGAGITLLSGQNLYYFFHGTSVLGEMLMTDNALGGVGIAPAANGRVVSQIRAGGANNIPDAIIDAAANMDFGDVLLLEAQEYDPVGGAYYWPVEITQPNYDAIRLASALGIVVLEAACNGGYDLDAYVDAGGNRIFDRTQPGFRDSGAIMVGAGSSAAPHTRMWFSNHGNRVDCYGWGENVDTTSTDAAGTDDTAYTTGFSGTSSATPIVAGAALIVQGMAEASLGYRFSPRELRRLLTINGTPSADPATDGIGVLPDLKAIITNDVLNLAPDLYLRDYVGDLGNPTAGMVSRSPDIILKQAAVADPTASFGPGSGTENDPALSDLARTTGDNHVYVRVLNRGGASAANVDVDVYWSQPSTLVTPNMWTYIGTATLPNVPTGNVLAVSDEILWPGAAVPAPGHYCFVGVAGNAEDPKPDPATFTDFDQFLAYVRNNNNIVWRNFDVANAGPSATEPPGFFAFDFQVPGAFDTSREFELESIARLPEGSRAFLEVPLWLREALRGDAAKAEVNRKDGTARLPLHPHGVHRIGTAILHAKSVAPCRLYVNVPEKYWKAGYDIAVRQLYRGEEVGRLTWRIGPVTGRKPRPDRSPRQEQTRKVRAARR